MLSLLTITGLMSAAALAAPVGDPVAVPDTELVRAVVRGDTDQSEIVNDDCPRDGRCDALWRRNGGSVLGQVTLVRGLAVFGEIGRASTQVRQADYRGDGFDFAGGLKAAVPVGSGGWWLGAQGRYLSGSGEGGELSSGAHERAEYAIGSASLMLAWREVSGGVQVWGGGQVAWAWDHHLQPLGSTDGVPLLDIAVGPRRPAAALAGGSLTSEPLGAGFSRSARLTIGAEGRLGQTFGASAWLGVLY